MQSRTSFLSPNLVCPKCKPKLQGIPACDSHFSSKYMIIPMRLSDSFSLPRMLRLALFFLWLCLLPKTLWAEMPTEVSGDVSRDYWQFLFLLESVSAAGQSEFHIRPFYGQYKNYERAYDYHYILYPVFTLHGTNYWRRWTWLYFFSGDDFYHKDSGRDSDRMLFLLKQGSGDSEEDDYFGIFPFYGTIKDFFGYEEFHYVLFPLYASWSYKDFTAYSVLWPVFLYGSSTNKKRSELRIFPLYSSKEHKGKYKRTSMIWPLFQWGSEALDKKEPRHYFFSFPLFGYKYSDDDNLFAWTFLWLPLIGGLASYGRDEVKQEKNFNFLWFIFQYHRSEDPGIRRYVFAPFYFYYRFGQIEHEATPYYKEASFITPLAGQLRTYSSIMDSEYNYLLPLYLESSRYYHKEREVERYLKVWPFFQYYSDSQGRRSFRSLTLLPWRADNFDKAFGPIFSLVEYKQFENQDQYFSLLLRAYSQYWNKDEGHYFLMGLEWHNTPDYWSFEILGGLFGIHRFKQGRNTLLRQREELPGDWALEFLWFDISRPDDIDAL